MLIKNIQYKMLYSILSFKLDEKQNRIESGSINYLVASSNSSIFGFWKTETDIFMLLHSENLGPI